MADVNGTERKVINAVTDIAARHDFDTPEAEAMLADGNQALVALTLSVLRLLALRPDCQAATIHAHMQLAFAEGVDAGAELVEQRFTLANFEEALADETPHG
jgi:hypothetical protein